MSHFHPAGVMPILYDNRGIEVDDILNRVQNVVQFSSKMVFFTSNILLLRIWLAVNNENPEAVLTTVITDDALRCAEFTNCEEKEAIEGTQKTFRFSSPQ